ncbi:MAG: outer membrane beta-barrel protein [Acidobacteriota bacterium]
MSRTYSRFLVTAIFLWAAAGVAYSQPLGIGFKLGVPFDDGLKVFPIATFSPLNPKGQPFVFGPYLEVRLGKKWAIEADGLHRSYNFQSSVSQATGTSWEFPVVIKRRFGNNILRPYFEGGAAFSRISDIKFATLEHRSNYGVVAGVGMELNLVLLKIAPELRYTGWGQQNFTTTGLQSTRNQLAVLVNFGF